MGESSDVWIVIAGKQSRLANFGFQLLLRNACYVVQHATCDIWKMRIKHFLFDLDGTITNAELLPLIAKAAGVEAQISELTKKTIAGEIPFESSLRERVKILSEIPVSRVNEVVLNVPLNPFIMEFIAANRDRCTIVTGNLDIWIRPLVMLIGIPALSSRATVLNDKIQSLDFVIEKGDAIDKLEGRVCAIGDGNNDYSMLNRADIGVAYGGVNNPAKSLYKVATHTIFDARTLCRFLSQL
jgi:HAD superfamily phosphoserine phosphatase-like hydrolase